MASSGPSRSASSQTDRKSSAAHSRKQSGPTASTLDRRTERTSRLTRETITHRARSPLKPSSDNRINGRKSREPEVPIAQEDEDTVKPHSLVPGGCTQIKEQSIRLILNSGVGPPSLNYCTYDRSSGIANISSPTGKRCACTSSRTTSESTILR